MTGNLFEWPAQDSTPGNFANGAPGFTDSTTSPASPPMRAATPQARRHSPIADFTKSALLFVLAGGLWLGGRAMPVLIDGESAVWILVGAALGTTLAYAAIRAAGHTRSTAASTVVMAGFVASLLATTYLFYRALDEELNGDFGSLDSYGWLAVLSVGGIVVVWSCVLPTAVTWLFTRLLKFLDPFGARTRM